MKNKKSLKSQGGFTLIELAIALAIIGFLLGTFLKGASMIKNAQIKRIKSDVDSIVAAVYNYQDRYGFLPGDDPEDQLEVGCKGNANGLIDNDEEAICAWQQLIAAGLISGDSSIHDEFRIAKTNPFGGKYLFRFGHIGDKAGNYLLITNIPGEVAKTLDRKYDDGRPNSGDIQTLGGSDDEENAGERVITSIMWFAF